MDITAVDYFRSKYVMTHPDIIGLLEVNLVDEVKNLQRITNIRDLEERKHQEALILWRRIPFNIRDEITRQFNVWIGNEQFISNSEDSYTDSDTDSDVDIIHEDMRNIEIKQKEISRVKKYVIEKKNGEQTRKLTTPIYASEGDEKLMGFVTDYEKKSSSMCDIYRLAFERAINNEIANVIWDNIKSQDYGDKSEKEFKAIRYVFSNVPYFNRKKFKETFPTIMLAVHNVLMGSGIYNDYPSFKDYKNLAAHIVLKGKDYCSNIVITPENVRKLLEYNDFHSIWDHYKKTL